MYPVLDAHADTLYELCFHTGGTLQNNNLCVSVDRLRMYPGYIQFFAAWIDDTEKTPYKTVLHMADRFYKELSALGQDVIQITKGTDFDRVIQEKKIGALLTVENGLCLEGSLFNLETLYRLGVRGLTLTWNGSNQIGDGVMTNEQGGLTPFGRQVVKEMNRLGMIVDVSHLSDKGFYEVLELSEKPVMASHSNARSVCGQKRNLSDEQIHFLSQQGGVMGLNVYPAFLTEKKEATLEDCLAHIEHIMACGGEDVIGLGSDFDGFSPPFVENLSHPGEYQNLLCLLEEKGYSKTSIKKLSHGNFIRVAKNNFEKN